MSNKPNMYKGISVFAFVLILILSGCGKGGQSAQAPQDSVQKNQTAQSPDAQAPLKEITVSITSAAQFGPVYLATEKDLWKQYGLKVKLLPLSSTAGVAALIDGSTQIAVGGPAYVGGAVKSDAVKIIGSGGKISLGLYSKKQLKIEELKGKTIAIIGAGGAVDTGVKTTLKALGLVPGKDVNLVYTGSIAASLASLSEGKVDVAGMTPPGRSQAEAKGFKLVEQLTDREGTYGLHVLLAVNKKFAAKDPAAVQAFMNAYAEANRQAKLDKEATKAATGKHLKTTDDKVLEDSYNAYRNFWPDDLHLPESEVQVVLDQLAESIDPSTKEAAKTKKPSDFIDNRYADAMKH